MIDLFFSLLVFFSLGFSFWFFFMYAVLRVELIRDKKPNGLSGAMAATFLAFADVFAVNSLLAFVSWRYDGEAITWFLPCTLATYLLCCVAITWMAREIWRPQIKDWFDRRRK